MNACPLLLAPMAGYTNGPTRRIAHRFGAAWSTPKWRMPRG